MLALHILFLREHNRIAIELQAENPTWNDEQVYQNENEGNGNITSNNVQRIFTLSGITLSEYDGYDSTINPEVFNVFTHSAFRMGHTQVGSWTLRLDENRSESTYGHIRLNEGFFDTRPLTEEGG